MLSAYLNILLVFSLIAVGYYLTNKQLFNSATGNMFSKLVLLITLPCSLFLTITKNFTKNEFFHLFSGMIIPLISIILAFFISHIFIKLFKVNQMRKGTFSTMFTFSNTIFLGIPINLAIFGEKALPYVLLYYFINTTFFWTVGVYQISRDNPKKIREKFIFRPVEIIKQIASPALLAFIIGLIWVIIDIPIADAIRTFLGYLADMTIPLSMFIIGIIVYEVGIKNLKINKDIVGVLLGRFVISPLLVWTIGQFISVPPLMLAVFIVQAAMPVQNSIPVIARANGADQKFAASSLGYSILIYLIYIPLLLKLIL